MRFGLRGDPPAGVILVDKPSGITSHDVVDLVRKKTGVKKVGHAGTLDPLASGLLVVLVGREFTKQQSKWLQLNKEYVCTARLGIATDTYDSEGQVIETASWEKIGAVKKQDLINLLPGFRGQITQTVPPFSAVKVKGEKLYHQARRGQLDQQELLQRQVEIHQLELLSWDKKSAEQKLFFTLHIACSSGTYVRSLIHDLGQKLRVGTTVTQLRRLSIGQYKIDEQLLYSVS